MAKYQVIGLKKGPNADPIIDSKTGEVIWDGVHREISLMSSDVEHLVDFFIENFRNTFSGHKWKITKLSKDQSLTAILPDGVKLPLTLKKVSEY